MTVRVQIDVDERIPLFHIRVHLVDKAPVPKFRRELNVDDFRADELNAHKMSESPTTIASEITLSVLSGEYAPLITFDDLDEHGVTDDAAFKHCFALRYEPSFEELQRSLARLTERWIALTTTLTTLSGHPSLHVYVTVADEAATERDPSLISWRKDGRRVNQNAGASNRLLTFGQQDIPAALGRVEAELRKWFDQADAFLHVYDDAFARMAFDRYFDFHIDLRKPPMLSYKKLLRWMVQFEHQLKAFSELPVNAETGILLINMHAVKEGTLLPAAQSSLRKLHNCVAGLIHDELHATLRVIERHIAMLKQNPETLEEAVPYLALVNLARDDIPIIDMRAEKLTQLLQLAVSSKVYVTADVMALYQHFTSMQLDYTATVLQAGATRAKLLVKFNMRLRATVEQVYRLLQDLYNNLFQPQLLDVEMNTAEVVSRLTSIKIEYAALKQRVGECKLFGEKLSIDYSGGQGPTEVFDVLMQSIEQGLDARSRAWALYSEWDALMARQMVTPFAQLDMYAMQNEVSRFLKAVSSLLQQLPKNSLVSTLVEHIQKFQTQVPALVPLRDLSVKARHWDQIKGILNVRFDEHTITLGQFLSYEPERQFAAITRVCDRAAKELTLENLIHKLEGIWEQTDLPLIVHGSTASNRSISILGVLDHVFLQLDESRTILSILQANRNFSFLSGSIEEWDGKLTQMGLTIHEWQTCQRGWLYLEHLFNTPDIQRQLVNESRMFSQMEKVWRGVMRRVQDCPNALRITLSVGILDSLQLCNKQLEQIFKSLESYLESKRTAFPRFYFISNDELLDILSQTKNTQAITPHLPKCFASIHRLIFAEPASNGVITGVASNDGETLELNGVIKARGNVEGWMSQLEEAMQTTLRTKARVAMVDYHGSKFEDWFRRHPSQVVLLVMGAVWTERVEKALSRSGSNSLANLLKRYVCGCASFHGILMMMLLQLDGVHRADIKARAGADQRGTQADHVLAHHTIRALPRRHCRAERQRHRHQRRFHVAEAHAVRLEPADRRLHHSARFCPPAILVRVSWLHVAAGGDGAD